MAQLDASPFPDDLPVAPPRRGPSRLTLALAAAVVLVAGVLIGIQAQKAFGSSALPTGQRSGFSGYGGQPFGGQSPGGQGFGGRQGFGGATVGTVEKISGEQVYLRTMDGSTVKVTTTGATTIEIAQPGKLSDLKTGGTIVVRGQKAADGSVSAVSISQGGGGR